MEGITLFPCSEPPDSFSLTLEWVYSEGLAKSLQCQTTHCLTLPLQVKGCLFKFIFPTSLLPTFQLQESSFCFLNLLKHSSCLCTCCSFLPGRLISLDLRRKDSLLLFRSQLSCYLLTDVAATQSRGAPPPYSSSVFSQTITLCPHCCIWFSL